MSRIFTFSNDVSPFVLFSRVHLITVLVILFSYVILYKSRNKLRNEKVDKIACYIITIALILIEMSIWIWRVYEGVWTVAESLPIHLCGISVFTCSIMLITKSYKIYEVVYFFAVCGATQALLTPDLGNVGFPHFRYYQFFIVHGLIIFAVLYMTFVHRFRPKFKSVFKAFILLNAIMPIIGLINYLTGGNYFYIARKPAASTIIDYLGEWPWYIITLEIIGLMMMIISYLPFAFEKILVKGCNNQESLDAEAL